MLKTCGFVVGTTIGSLLSIDFTMDREFEKALILLPVFLALVATLYYELMGPDRFA